MLAHLHVKNLALIEEIEVEFGPGLNILTGETGAGKSILLGSMQLILGAKTSKNMIRENASYALFELLFQVENEKALETLKALDICPEDGQVLLSRKIMDGRSINKINGETSTVGQMKAAAACLWISMDSTSISHFCTRISSLQSWMHMEKKKSFLQRRKYLWHIKNTANAKQNLVP